jgi:ubiquinone/menaquinone biosynthesis C-methylase UbiE
LIDFASEQICSGAFFIGNSKMNDKKEKEFSFSSRASKYDDGLEGKASQKFYNLLLREIKLRPGIAILDVGCGTGKLLSKFANTCEINGYGIDVEENMIHEAKAKNMNMQFDVSRCDAMPFAGETFDVVTACMAYHHFDNKQGFIKEAARVLKADGVLYIADPIFPWIVRKVLNRILKIFRVVGEFYTAKEIENQFAENGFITERFAVDGYAQVIKLKKN